jgi:hypothetical protein
MNLGKEYSASSLMAHFFLSTSNRDVLIELGVKKTQVI